MLALSVADLERLDVGLMNLRCAEGLPGSENLNVPAALRQLDQWAAKVAFETRRHLYRAHDPRYANHFAHSEARLKAEFVAQVLQEDCGVHYNTARINDPDHSNSKDIFIHGMLGSDNGGTCISMPVLYAAVARRLGYPVKFVLAKEHVFCRWEELGQRFNIDCAGDGVSYHEDAHYRAWPYRISDEEVQRGEYLKSLTPVEELGLFIKTRADCLVDLERYEEAIPLYSQALARMPQSRDIKNNLTLAKLELDGKLGKTAAAQSSRKGGSPPQEPTQLRKLRSLGMEAPTLPSATGFRREENRSDHKMIRGN